MCPNCKQAVLAARIESIQLYALNGDEINGAKYSCMSCGAVLSLGIDPFGQKNEIVSEVLVALGRSQRL